MESGTVDSEVMRPDLSSTHINVHMEERFKQPSPSSTKFRNRGDDFKEKNLCKHCAQTIVRKNLERALKNRYLAFFNVSLKAYGSLL